MGRVLVACERSQTIANEFRRQGIEAFSCDILPCYGGHPEYHIIGDAIEVSYSGNWDLMIAHPPCTYLSNAGACRLFSSGVINQERYMLGCQAKDFFLSLYNAPIKRVAIENPVPMKVFDLPIQTQIIEPYYFDEPYSKKTLLWLKNLPILFATVFNYPVASWTVINRNATIRSQTFQGIANAMVDQWKCYV